jgi:hypothetical protein
LLSSRFLSLSRSSHDRRHAPPGDQQQSLVRQRPSERKQTFRARGVEAAAGAALLVDITVTRRIQSVCDTLIFAAYLILLQIRIQCVCFLRRGSIRVGGVRKRWMDSVQRKTPMHGSVSRPAHMAFVWVRARALDDDRSPQRLCFPVNFYPPGGRRLHSTPLPSIGGRRGGCQVSFVTST